MSLSTMKPLIVCFICISVDLFAQQNYPTEKAYIQISKNHFEAGDTLHFSAFTWSINDTAASRVLYVELFSETGSLIAERTLKIDNEPVKHFFVIDSSVRAANYKLRAYTHYLTGFGQNAFFEQQIKIGKVSTENPVQLAIEGGSLVASLPSRLVVQTPKAGQSGQIKDDQNAIFSSFASDSDGLAFVPIVPQMNRVYRVELDFGKDDTRAYAIGKAKANGATLQIDKKDTMIVAKIYTQKPDIDSIMIRFYNQNNLVFEQRSAIRPLQILKISASVLPIGLLHCVVMDTQNQVLTERLWYNEKEALSPIARYNVLGYFLTQPLYDEAENINKTLVFNTLKVFHQKTALFQEYSLTRRGVAMDTKNNVLKKTDLLVWAVQKNFGIRTIKTDTAGVFEISNIENEGLVELKVQTDDNNLVVVKWLPRTLPPLDETKTQSAQLTTTGIDVPEINGKQLEEVVVKARRNFDKIRTRLGITYPVADKTFEEAQLLSVASTSTLRALQLLYPFLNVKTDNTGQEYLERRNKRISIIVDGFALAEGFTPPVVEAISRIDLVSDISRNSIFIYTKNLVNIFDDTKTAKRFEGNAFLKGFDDLSKK